MLPVLLLKFTQILLASLSVLSATAGLYIICC
jgi:hypothetical protein